jgi:hypothetical protein
MSLCSVIYVVYYFGLFVYYKSRNRELKMFGHFVYYESIWELEHLKTKTRLKDEKFPSVKGECET